MFKKNLGDVVAADMDSRLKSDEFDLLFGKTAAKCKCDDDCKKCKKGDCDECSKCGKKDDDKSKDKDKKDDDKDKKKKCTCDCKKCEKGDCSDCKKCDCGKKDEDDDKDDKKALEDIAQHLIRISAELDDLDFGKTSTGVLYALDALIAEAQTQQVEIIDDKEIAVPEEQAEQMLESLSPELLGGMEQESYSDSFIGGEEPSIDQMVEGLDVGGPDVPAFKTPKQRGFSGAKPEDEPLFKEEDSLDDLLEQLQSLESERVSNEPLETEMGNEALMSSLEDGELSEASLSLPPGAETEGLEHLESFDKELKNWLNKNADQELKDHFSGKTVVDFELSADLKELITASDDLEQQLVNLAADNSEKDEDEEDEDEDFEDEE